MLGSGNGDRIWKEKFMEGEEGLWTVESLRGRLLAERLVSRTAKEDAELMGNKLIELEKQLKLETELRNKAEKKLKFLMKKMESLKLSPSNSSASSSDLNLPKELKLDFQIEGSMKCNIEGEMNYSLSSEDLGSDEKANAAHQTSSIGSGWGSIGTSDSRSNAEDPSPGDIKNGLGKHLMAEDVRQASTFENELTGENNPLDYLDNTLALVPTDAWSASQVCQPMKRDDVCDVLAALRHAREKLQNTMGRRNDIYARSVELCSGV